MIAVNRKLDMLFVIEEMGYSLALLGTALPELSSNIIFFISMRTKLFMRTDPQHQEPTNKTPLHHLTGLNYSCFLTVVFDADVISCGLEV